MLGVMSREPMSIGYYLWEVPRSLCWLSCSGHKAPHRDGMGLVYKNSDGRMTLHRWGHEELDQLDVKGSRALAREKTTLLIAHARQASSGYREMTAAQAHPFVEDGIYLAHNGTIRDADSLKGGKATDSEKLLHWLASHWQPRNLLGMKDTLKKLLTRVEDYSAINLFITEGNHLYAFCCYMQEPEHYTLHYHQTNKQVIVASEPLDDGWWQPLRNGELLEISPAMALKKAHVI